MNDQSPAVVPERAIGLPPASKVNTCERIITPKQQQQQNQPQSNNNPQQQRLISEYSPIQRKCIKDEIIQLQNVFQEQSLLWESELSFYENGDGNPNNGEDSIFSSQNDLDVETKVIRPSQEHGRNVCNQQGRVKNCNLYPYHDLLYPLLNFYDDAPFRPPVSGEDEVEGSMLVPTHAILSAFSSMLGCGDDEKEKEELDSGVSSDLSLWMAGLLHQWEFRHASPLSPTSPLLFPKKTKQQEITTKSCSSTSPPAVKKMDGKDWSILCRVIRHATSDLQRDFGLAAVAVLCMSELHCAEDLDCLRRLIAVVGSVDYPNSCHGRCHLDGGVRVNGVLEPPNHSCTDVKMYFQSIEVLITHGIRHFTQTHAIVMSAWVLRELDEISASAIDTVFEDETSSRSSSSVMSIADSTPEKMKRRKILLKQNLYHYGTVPLRFKSRLMEHVISAIGRHAALDRMRMRLLQQKHNNNDDVKGPSFDEVRDSWLNCIRALANIAESCVRRLPQNEVAADLGGKIVHAFADAFVSYEDFSLPKDSEEEEAEGGITPTTPVIPSYSILNATRYSDTVTYASITNRSLLTPIIPQDVIDVVRAFYVRNLVSIPISGYGYGGWLSACRLPVTPLDPILYDHASNYPMNDDATYHYFVDEENKRLTGDRLAARYDLSLLMLIRAWRAPWTPNSHKSFQLPFQHAAKTLALCTNRYHLPTEITNIVISFLHRDWWTDERKKCWCHDCQLGELSCSIRAKVSLLPQQQQQQQTKTPTTKNIHTCKGCDTVLYCSKEHLKFIMQDGHKRVCGNPPFCSRINKEEERFCQTVLEYDAPQQNNNGGIPNYNTAAAAACDSVDMEMEEENQSDEESVWESVDSNEEEELEEENAKITKTDFIHGFFEKYYKLQKHEIPAFANFFAYE